MLGEILRGERLGGKGNRIGGGEKGKDRFGGRE